MILTKAGEIIYETANVVLDKLMKAEFQIKKMVLGEVKEIRLSTECYSSYHWLPSVLKQFHNIYPNVEIKIVTEATHYPWLKPKEGFIDITINSDPVKDSNIKYIELFQDE